MANVPSAVLSLQLLDSLAILTDASLQAICCFNDSDVAGKTSIVIRIFFNHSLHSTGYYRGSRNSTYLLAD